jgi:hypothetical protein
VVEWVVVWVRLAVVRAEVLVVAPVEVQAAVLVEVPAEAWACNCLLFTDGNAESVDGSASHPTGFNQARYHTRRHVRITKTGRRFVFAPDESAV